MDEIWNVRDDYKESLLRTGTRDSTIQDDEEVEVPKSPDLEIYAIAWAIAWVEIKPKVPQCQQWDRENLS